MTNLMQYQLNSINVTVAYSAVYKSYAIQSESAP